MKKTRPLRWWHKLFHKWSRHGDVDRAYRWFYGMGYQNGWNACYADFLKKMGWPGDGPQTGPIIARPIAPVPVPPGALLATFNQTPGGIHTKMLKAISKAQHAALVEQQREKEY